MTPPVIDGVLTHVHAIGARVTLAPAGLAQWSSPETNKIWITALNAAPDQSLLNVTVAPM